MLRINFTSRIVRISDNTSFIYVDSYLLNIISITSYLQAVLIWCFFCINAESHRTIANWLSDRQIIREWNAVAVCCAPSNTQKINNWAQSFTTIEIICILANFPCSTAIQEEVSMAIHFWIIKNNPFSEKYAFKENKNDY